MSGKNFPSEMTLYRRLIRSDYQLWLLNFSSFNWNWTEIFHQPEFIETTFQRNPLYAWRDEWNIWPTNDVDTQQEINPRAQ